MIKYVVSITHKMQDGEEVYARVFPSLKAAYKYSEERKNGFEGDSMDLKLFELGRQLPLEFTTVEEQVIVETKTVVKVKRKERK